MAMNMYLYYMMRSAHNLNSMTVHYSAIHVMAEQPYLNSDDHDDITIYGDDEYGSGVNHDSDPCRDCS